MATFNTLINNQSVQILLAKKYRENYFQNILHMPGKGVTEEFSADTSAGYIRVVRALPHGVKGRQLGASANGGNFNGHESYVSTSSEYSLPLLYVYDGNFDIPEVQSDMLPLNIVEQEAKNISGEVATQINGSTIAAQLAKTFNADGDRTETYILKLPASPSETDARDALLDAVARLENGDIANGIQTFPTDEREIIARPEFFVQLFKGNNVIAGGSNYAQEMLARGVISPDTYGDNGTSYKGEFMEIPLYLASKAIWNEAEAWLTAEGLALPAGTLNGVLAIACAAMGTARGVAMPESFKQIPCPIGAGIRIQPLVRWGVECWLPDSVAVVASNGFTAPADLAVSAPGSRA